MIIFNLIELQVQKLEDLDLSILDPTEIFIKSFMVDLGSGVR